MYRLAHLERNNHMSQKALLFCFAALMQASKSKSRNKLPAHVTFRRKSCSSHGKSAVETVIVPFRSC